MIDPNDNPNENVFQSIHLPLRSVIRHQYHLPKIDDSHEHIIELQFMRFNF